MGVSKLRRSAREARRLLSHYASAISTDADRGLLRLPSSTWRVLTARLAYDIGPRHYSLYRLREVPRHEWSDYVTDKPQFKQGLLARNKEASVVQNKLEFFRHCLEHDLPTIPVLWLVADDPDSAVPGVDCVSSAEAWRAKMRGAPEELFIKPVEGTRGQDAFVVRRAGDQVHYLGRSGSIDELFRYLSDRLQRERGWLVQPRMRPSAALAGAVTSTGLSTIRTVTHTREGKAGLLFAVIKLTVGDNAVDSFSAGRTGNLVAAVDLASGELLEAWGSVDRRWPVMRPYSHHPDSAAPIKGTVLPFWEELTELALRAQSSLPAMQTLGWDIAATADGVVLVEANAAYDLSILQIAHQRGLKRELEAALGQPA